MLDQVDGLYREGEGGDEAQQRRELRKRVKWPLHADHPQVLGCAGWAQMIHVYMYGGLEGRLLSLHS